MDWKVQLVWEVILLQRKYFTLEKLIEIYGDCMVMKVQILNLEPFIDELHSSASQPILIQFITIANFCKYVSY